MHAVYDYFAHATAGSFANHLAHCVLALGLQLAGFVCLSPFRARLDAASIATAMAASFYVGRSQMQVEALWRPAPWWQSWLFWTWPADPALGAVFPLVSSLIVLAGFVAVERITKKSVETQ